MSELDGFSHAITGILDNNEQIVKGSDGLSDSGLFRIDATTSRGVLNASISGLAPQTQTISGSNQVVGISGSGTGAITLTLGVNNLPEQIEYKLIGAQRSASGAWYQDKDTRSPYSAVELTSQNPDGDAVHIALLKGQFYVQPQNLRTNNGTGGVNRATDSLQFKAINRHSDGRVIEYGFESDPAFNLDAFRNEVFPGADINAVSDAVNAQDNSNNNSGNFTDPNNITTPSGDNNGNGSGSYGTNSPASAK